MKREIKYVSGPMMSRKERRRRQDGNPKNLINKLARTVYDKVLLNVRDSNAMARLINKLGSDDMRALYGILMDEVVP